MPEEGYGPWLKAQEGAKDSISERHGRPMLGLPKIEDAAVVDFSYDLRLQSVDEQSPEDRGTFSLFLAQTQELGLCVDRGPNLRSHDGSGSSQGSASHTHPSHRLFPSFRN